VGPNYIPDKIVSIGALAWLLGADVGAFWLHPRPRVWLRFASPAPMAPVRSSPRASSHPGAPHDVRLVYRKWRGQVTASAVHNEPIEWQRRMSVIRERAEFIIRLLSRSRGMYSERHQAWVVTTCARFQQFATFRSTMVA
jgi:hypothetical protein